MNPESGGPSNEERQRQAAENIARQKVFDAYEGKEDGASKTGKMKNENIRLTREDWMKYHSAWQEYYQKYYSEYYETAAKNYVAAERLKNERKAIEEAPAVTEVEESAAPAIEESEVVAQTLREKIREKARKKGIGNKKHKKLVPIIAGASVVLVFLFLQYNRLIFAPIAAYVSPGNAPAGSIEAVDPTVSGTISADPKLIIPKLNIDVPVAFGIQTDDVMNAMVDGVAHYRIKGASAFPGEIGNMVITGHSAGDIYSSDPYKYIFSGLERLSAGDLIYVNYNSKRYVYKVTKFETVEPTNVQALIYSTDKPMLTLITCTPLGTSRYRLLVTAEQISPSYTDAPSAEPVMAEDITGDDMPSNEKTLLEKFWDWVTGA